ncbi:MAG TPA: acetyl-CoA synthetase [Treponema sp.]|nr:acetyl-CoA synthetase [Treponema sp.]
MNFLNDYVENFDKCTTYEEMRKYYKLKCPENFNFAYDIIDRYAKEEPQKRAIVWCNDKGEEKTFTFKEISEYTQKTANFLVAHGIKKGDTVMLVLRRRYEFWFFIYALNRIGAIAIPATYLLLQSDYEYRNKAADVKMIVTFDDDRVYKNIEGALPSSPSVKTLVTVGQKREGWVSFHDEIEQFSADFPRPTGENATHNNDPMLIYFTSGTSGYPKMALHDFTYPLGHITTGKLWHGVIDDGLHLTLAETGWAKAGWGKIYGQWIAGTAQFIYDFDTFRATYILQMVEKYHITTFCAPPTVYRYLIRQDLSKFNLSSLVKCTTAGEPLNGEVYRKWLEQTGHKIYEGFGQSESSVIIGNFPGMEPRPGSMGKPAPGYDVEIVHPDGSRCAPHENGEVIIHVENGKPFGLLAGYYKNQEETDKAFAGGIYRTKDIAYYDEDGYMWFVGRNDDVIKTAGYRVSPFEVESILQQHPAVLECAVTGVPDKRRGNIVKATIVLTAGYEATTELEHDIQEYVQKNTASYKRPKLIEFVKELPKTTSGKIKRNTIRDEDAKKVSQ